MSAFRFPNETEEYRAKRDALLDAEVELRAHTESVAAQRRELPLGGRLAQEYRFTRMVGGERREVPFAELFGDHSTLLLYSMMFGSDWDAPCPSCTSIVDGMNANWRAVEATAAIGAVAAARAEQLDAWTERRGWTIPLVSGMGNSYLLDYAGFETDQPGLVSILNVFRRTPEGIFHSWGSELLSRPMESGHPRHVDSFWPMWNLLDLSPEGRGDAIIPKQDFEHAVFTREVLGQRDA